ncbi:hypothetical protein BMF77_03264 [Dolichospermum sp. UHCC 0315A]|uniref:hypothetical protein n=1 Tax=Dolichospermum sp. UHCC 0315A TaxID=1914871 RepID=UPI0011E75681|nr:hypothetical protein [Dolichospermum sp. UHCC 0315A]QEI42653.1 hypothetical protein BMF77_03264 [Dolichospermum sp. UHCC 0315A]
MNKEKSLVKLVDLSNLNQAEKFYQQIDFNEKKIANVLANKARIYEYSEDWNNSIHAFLQLLETAKRIGS